MPVFFGVATGLAMTAPTKARAACLIGWPAAHSRSPLIHHYWLRALGIEGGYNIEAVPPEGFAEFVLHLSTHGFVGANVTIPHKERALALTKPDERARAVGAANTLWYEGAELRSTNTDIEGFIGNLDACAQGWDAAGDALVLGAGGSSRALELDAGLLPSHAVVADLVYVPLETPLLVAARARGLKTADGLGMLLHQAVRGFELWFGQRPGGTPEFRALVEADPTRF